MVKVTTKWSAPLKFDWVWHLEKFDPILARSISRAFKKTTGKLLASFLERVSSRNSVEFSSPLPYAAAQEFGAEIPARFPSGKALVFQSGGATVFATSAKGFHLDESPYLTPAIEQWSEETDVRWK